MLKSIVKARGITNLTDARYFAAWNVDYLGFDVENALLSGATISSIKEMKDWIEGPTFVAELTESNLHQSAEIIDFLSLSTIQVGMFTALEYLKALQSTTIIKEVVVEKSTSAEALSSHLESYFDYVDFFFLDFSKNAIELEDLKRNSLLTIKDLKQLCGHYQIFLGMDFQANYIDTILKDISPYGLSVKGGAEEKVGYKSFDEIDELFEELEVGE